VDTSESKSSSSKVKLSRREIENLLKHGAYHVFKSEGEEEARSAQFCAEDIDKILERNSRVVKYESAAMAGSTFAKASFVASEKDKEVDVDDPNFWNKIGIKEKEPEKLDSRRRKRTERFGMADDDEMAGALPDEDDDYHPKEGDSSQYFHLWSKAARDKFVDAILAYGYGRWDMIKQDTEGLLNHRTEQDLKEYALGFILQCVCQATKSSKVPAGPQLVERVKKDVIHITKIQKKKKSKRFKR